MYDLDQAIWEQLERVIPRKLFAVQIFLGWGNLFWCAQIGDLFKWG